MADKMAHCSTISETLCHSSLSAKSSASEFSKYLNVSMEMFFTLVDDDKADVRLMADEHLNKVIRHLMDTHVGRLQVRTDLKHAMTSLLNDLSPFSRWNCTRKSRRTAPTVV